MVTPRLHIEELRGQCGSLLVKETTGLYSSTNTGGYGSPNIAVNQVVKTELLIKFPDGQRFRWNVNFTPNTTSRLEIGQLVSVSSHSTVAPANCGNTGIGDYVVFMGNCGGYQKAGVDYFAAGCYEFTYNIYTGTLLSPVLHASFVVVKFLHCEIGESIRKASLDATVGVDTGKATLANGHTQWSALNNLTLADSLYEALLHDCAFDCVCAKSKVEMIKAFIHNLTQKC